MALPEVDMRAASCVLVILLVFIGTDGVARSDELPADAVRVVQDFEKGAMEIQRKADEEIQPLRKKAVEKLKVLQDKYCREARLDEALAIRDKIKEIKGIRPDPGQLRIESDDIGKVLHFEVVGDHQGTVWGSEVYTSDSRLAAAAVHAGVLKPGQKGVVTVRILPGQQIYRGTAANGVTSRDWGKWNLSFTVEKGRI
jgi:hypothetical protein